MKLKPHNSVPRGTLSHLFIAEYFLQGLVTFPTEVLAQYQVILALKQDNLIITQKKELTEAFPYYLI